MAFAHREPLFKPFPLRLLCISQLSKTFLYFLPLCIAKMRELVIHEPAKMHMQFFLAGNKDVVNVACRLYSLHGEDGVQPFFTFMSSRYKDGCHEFLWRTTKLLPNEIPVKDRVQFLTYCLWILATHRVSDNLTLQNVLSQTTTGDSLLI